MCVCVLGGWGGFGGDLGGRHWWLMSFFVIYPDIIRTPGTHGPFPLAHGPLVWSFRFAFHILGTLEKKYYDGRIVPGIADVAM